MRDEEKLETSTDLHVDWDVIRCRMEEVAKRIEHGTSLSTQEKKSILQKRAILFGRPAANANNEQPRLNIIEFFLASERYAFETSYIAEVCALKEFTPIPGAPQFVVGIINVRGRIVSIIDLRKIFDVSPKGLSEFNKVIVIRDGTLEFGIVADMVGSACQISSDEIQPPLPTLIGARSEYLSGITNNGLAILNAAKLLADPRLRVRTETI